MKTLSFNPYSPVFVKKIHDPLIVGGKKYTRDQHLPWMTLNIPEETVRILFNSDQVYHNDDLEAEMHVGDRLEEMSLDQLHSTKRMLNKKIEVKCGGSKVNYKKACIKHSAVEDRQRTLIRNVLHIKSNQFLMDYYEEIRDSILRSPKEQTSVEEVDEDEQE